MKKAIEVRCPKEAESARNAAADSMFRKQSRVDPSTPRRVVLPHMTEESVEAALGDCLAECQASTGADADQKKDLLLERVIDEGASVLLACLSPLAMLFATKDEIVDAAKSQYFAATVKGDISRRTTKDHNDFLIRGQKIILNASSIDQAIECLPKFNSVAELFHSLLQRPKQHPIVMEAKKIYFDFMKVIVFTEPQCEVKFHHQQNMTKAMRHILDQCEDLELAKKCILQTTASLDDFMDAIQQCLSY